MEKINHKNWLELANRVFAFPVIPAEALFVHGWGDLHEEILHLVGQTCVRTKPRIIILNGEEAYEAGSQGFSYWQKFLVQKYKIDKQIIRKFLPGKHTLDEAKGFLKIAEEEKLNSAILISVPPHIIRAFLTVLGEIQARILDIALYPQTLKAVAWEEPVVISGITSDAGDENTTRLGRLVAECARIVQYRQRFQAGDNNFVIASVEEGLEYLQNLSKKRTL